MRCNGYIPVKNRVPVKIGETEAVFNSMPRRIVIDTDLNIRCVLCECIYYYYDFTFLKAEALTKYKLWGKIQGISRGKDGKIQLNGKVKFDISVAEDVNATVYSAEHSKIVLNNFVSNDSGIVAYDIDVILNTHSGSIKMTRVVSKAKLQRLKRMCRGGIFIKDGSKLKPYKRGMKVTTLKYSDEEIEKIYKILK